MEIQFPLAFSYPTLRRSRDKINWNHNRFLNVPYTHVYCGYSFASQSSYTQLFGSRELLLVLFKHLTFNFVCSSVIDFKSNSNCVNHSITNLKHLTVVILSSIYRVCIPLLFFVLFWAVKNIVLNSRNKKISQANPIVTGFTVILLNYMLVFAVLISML